MNTPIPMPENYPFKLPTPASSVISRFGFSQKEAAAFYGVRLDTIKKWMSGRMEMPDDLYLASLVKLDQLSDLATFIAERYCDQAVDNETGEHMSGQYISLPTATQLVQGSFPMSKGFFDNFFADIAAKCYAAGPDRFCYLTPCEPEEDFCETNFWLIPWFERGMFMDMCIERDDEIVRFDVSLYDHLRRELETLENAQVSIPEPIFANEIRWRMDNIGIEIPYVPDWYAEAFDLSDEQLALVNTTVRLSFSESYEGDSADFSDLITWGSPSLHFVEDDEIRPMFEAFESQSDADLTATNENVVKILREVFGTKKALLERIGYLD